ncbi:amelotin [Gracilinanus agilis]|uniref:amelotin n=1 Tax=Gracilinanus agilis TaxID=191870 RepID=UPI001CFEC8BA|nr:amelotin [Gracilinanus agilis]
MQTALLLFCLLGAIQSLPILQLMGMYPVHSQGQQQAQQQLYPGLGLPPTKLVLDQPALFAPQQPNQFFPPLGQTPLTQMFSVGTDVQLMNAARGLLPGIQLLPLTLGDTNAAPQVPPQQMLPIIVAQIGAQGALLSSEELPMAPQIFTGLLIQPFGTGATLPTGQSGIDANTQDAALPAGQTGGNPAIWGTPEGQLPTPSGPDDVFEATIPVGIQRATEGSTTEAPNGGFFQTHKTPLGPKETAEGSMRQKFLGDPSSLADMNPSNTREFPSPASELIPAGGNLMIPLIAPQDPDSATNPTMLILRGDTHLPV